MLVENIRFKQTESLSEGLVAVLKTRGNVKLVKFDNRICNIRKSYVYV